MARSRWGLLVPMKLVEGILMLFLHVIIISMFFLTVHSQLSLQSSDDYIFSGDEKEKICYKCSVLGISFCEVYWIEE